MSKNHKQHIEQKITNTLQSDFKVSAKVPSDTLLQAVRRNRRPLYQRPIPLWQAVAASFLLLWFGHHWFPKTIVQEKLSVQTKIQPSLLCQTDTLIQYQTIEKIVRIPVPVKPVEAQILSNPISPMIDAIDSTADMLNPSAIVTTNNNNRVSTNSITSKSVGRSVQEDADLMEFIIESEQFSGISSPLKQD